MYKKRITYYYFNNLPDDKLVKKSLSNDIMFKIHKLKSSGNFNKAREYFDSLLVVDKNNPLLYRLFAHLVYDSNNLFSILDIINLFKQHNCPNYFINYFKGILLFREGKLDESMRLFKEALRSDSQNPYIINNLGVNYLLLGKSKRAYFLFKRALKICRKRRDIKGTSLISGNIGLYYIEEGELISAKKVLNSPSCSMDNSYFVQEIVNVYCNLAELYIHKKDFKTALYRYRKSLYLSRRNHLRYQCFRSLVGLGKIYLELGKASRSLSILKIALLNATLIKDEYWKTEILSQIGFCYIEIGDIESSKKYLLESLQLQNKRYTSTVGLNNQMNNNNIEKKDLIKVLSNVTTANTFWSYLVYFCLQSLERKNLHDVIPILKVISSTENIINFDELKQKIINLSFDDQKNLNIIDLEHLSKIKKFQLKNEDQKIKPSADFLFSIKKQLIVYMILDYCSVLQSTIKNDRNFEYLSNEDLHHRYKIQNDNLIVSPSNMLV